MKFRLFAVCFSLFSIAAFGQTSRGTLTGTVTDPSGAVVPSATIIATNTDTQAHYQTVTTQTGNYTLEEMPGGPYVLTVQAPGFFKYVQQGVQVLAAQTLRIDIKLQVGQSTESVTVTAEASLLRTESTDVSHNMDFSNLANLPVNYQGRNSGNGAVENPIAFVELLPGASLVTYGSDSIRVNGLPTDTTTFMVEGQNSSNPLGNSVAFESQASAEALQEVALQTSNFSAEYGQVGGGLINFTSKSGTNNVHGSLYEDFLNSDLGAGQPFSNNGNGQLVRPHNEKNDYGLTLGGPLVIPHVYNGHNKTFYFLSFEQYRDDPTTSGVFQTVPTAAMRSGNFSSILTGKNLGTDPVGNGIAENSIYDPLSAYTVNGYTEKTAFPGNIIPLNRLSPVALKIQALIPEPTKAGNTNNWAQSYTIPHRITIPTIKIDHNLSDNQKVSLYISELRNDLHGGNGPDGLPYPITSARDNHFRSPTLRLNYDRTITPTTLLHVGIGYLQLYAPDSANNAVLNYNSVTQLGLVGAVLNDFTGTPAYGFPRLTGLTSSFGGMLNMGPSNANHYLDEKPTAVASASFVRGNHSYKIGASWMKEADTDTNVRGSQGIYNFSNIETAQPSTNGESLSGVTGFAYASFLLGLVDNASLSTPQDPQYRHVLWALYAQDTWKITPRLTFDYGLRWDYAGAFSELWNRMANFSATTPNPSAGGLPGATIYDGYGTGRCNCSFTKNYPYAFGPRLGVAYQFAPKMVLRAGWGVTYSQGAQYNYISNNPIVGVGFNQLTWFPTAFGTPAVTLDQGLQYTQAQLYGSSLDPGIRPSPGQINSPAYWLDPQGGRPGRIMQWNIGIQREISKDLLVEAAYVGNTGVWEQADSLVDLNGITPQHLASLGLNITSASARSLLTSPMNSPQVIAAGFKLPYAGFPSTLTLAQALRPFPQFGTIPVLWAPDGNSWYNALQAKVTKRYGHGLTAQAAFTYAQELEIGADSQSGGAVAINDVYNRQNNKYISPSSIPFILAFNVAYQVPKFGSNRWIRASLGDWTLGFLARYQSGLPILVPYSNNGLQSDLLRSANGAADATFDDRVPGQPLFLKNINCGCIDPTKTLVLNPAAWTDPGPGNWGTSAPYYNDYRYERRPEENANFGRVFPIREKLKLTVRAEFYNVFNRTYLNNPTSTNAAATAVQGGGLYTSGFGYINSGTTFEPPRTGQIVMRLVW
jgi:hypothetical protein